MAATGATMSLATFTVIDVEVPTLLAPSAALACSVVAPAGNLVVSSAKLKGASVSEANSLLLT